MVVPSTVSESSLFFWRPPTPQHYYKIHSSHVAHLPKGLNGVHVLGASKEPAHDLGVVEHDRGGRAEGDGDEHDEEAAVDGQFPDGRPLKEFAVVAPVHHLSRRPHS